ncbi:MAG TPA: hypothetical protein VNP04_28740, partial [Alphaproteobacteria bacterium]|nr:hypothetical protein [Alphaproteobacteria bacterium]
VADGYFTAGYDNIANGAYDYILTARDGAGNVIGTYTGVVEIRRGGQSLPAIAGSPAPDALIPLTTFRHDVFGNVLAQTRHARGAQADRISPVGTDNTNDQHTYLFYDTLGRAIRRVDAEGRSEYSSYDALNHVRKQWQTLTSVEGTTQQKTALYEYDRLGQQDATTNVTNGQLDRFHSQYNAFGEILAKGLNGGAPPEYFDYDNAGRLWRTNQKDGTHHVHLYDLTGNATAEIRSIDTDLKAAFTTPAQVASSANVVRTNTRYDLRGRVVEQTQPSFSIVAPQFDDIAVAISVSDRYLSHSFSTDTSSIRSGTGLDAVTTYYFDNRIDLSWQSLEGWGDGQ